MVYCLSGHDHKYLRFENLVQVQFEEVEIYSCELSEIDTQVLSLPFDEELKEIVSYSPNWSCLDFAAILTAIFSIKFAW